MISKQALGSTLWGMADILRDKVEDYKSYILTLLFYKRLSDNYSWELQKAISEFKSERGYAPNDAQLNILTQKTTVKIQNGCFWDDVRNTELNKKNTALARVVTTLADDNSFLKGVLNTVKWDDPAPDGSGGYRLSPTVLTNLINYLSAVDMSNNNVSVDVLGDAYEYLIKRFADENKGGTTAGQFYTPQEVVDIVVRYLKPQKGDTIYDPTCGSGGFLINSAKYIKAKTGNQKDIRLFGQEDVWNTWAICSINMILHGLDAVIKKGDTILSPEHKMQNDDKQDVIRTFSKVCANFPFSQENWAKNGEPKKDKKGNAVTKKDGSPQLTYAKEWNDPYSRMKYGTPPYSNGDFAFIQHIISSIGKDGKAGIVCPQGVFFRGQSEKTEEEDGKKRKADIEYLIRKGIVDSDIIDAIVVLPGNLFYGTTIPGAILFIDKNKPKSHKGKILMVYAAREGWYREDPNMNVLEMHHILRISTMLEAWGDINVAKSWMEKEKERYFSIIQEDLDFELSEIMKRYWEDVNIAERKFKEAQKTIDDKKASGKQPTKSDTQKLESAKKSLEKLVSEYNNAKDDANNRAQKKRDNIDSVEQELISMFQDPELRKRYFSIVEKDKDVLENEYNLTITRYVDTFEPEEEINLDDAIQDFKDALLQETKLQTQLNKILELIK